MHSVLMNMENDVRTGTTEAYLPNLNNPLDTVVSLSSDFFGMENVNK